MLDAKKNKGKPFPYLRNPNVKWFSIDLSGLREMPFEDHELDRFGVRRGDVLICEGGEAGRAAIWESDRTDVKIQKAIHRVRCGPDLHNRFLVHRLMFDYFSGRLNDYYTGTTIKHLTGQDLAKYEMLLPPLAEQKRIAGILDAADALRAKRREALAQLDSLLQATFLDLFGDPVTNPKGWDVKSLEDSGAKTKVGPFGSLLHVADYIAGGVPLVNPKHMVDGQIVHGGDETVSEEKASELEDYRLKVGDLLVARRGEMGRCVIVGPEHSGWLCGTGSFYIRTSSSNSGLLPEFLSACVSSQPMRKFLEHLSGGAIMPSLSGTQIKNVRIPIPPMKEQEKFVRTCQSISDHLSRQSEHLAELDALFASLQFRAFRGEL